MPDAIEQLLAEQSDNPTGQEGTGSVNIDGKEYSVEELRSSIETGQNWEKRYKDLQSYTAKNQNGNPSNTPDVKTGNTEDLDYLKSLGVITKEEYEAKLNSLEERLSQRDLNEQVEDLRFEIDGLAKDHSFVDPKELIDYMAAKSDQGTNLAPAEAARLLYFDQFSLLRGVRRRELPATDTSLTNSVEEPVGKTISYQNAGQLREAMMEEFELGIE